ncbi:MAG: hypothetical protein R3Y59_11095, partial [bacterium]
SIQQSEGEFFLSFLSEKIFYPIPCNIQIPQLHLQVEFKNNNLDAQKKINIPLTTMRIRSKVSQLRMVVCLMN